MNTQIQQPKGNDAAKVDAEYQKAIDKNQKASPNENAPAFTKSAPVSQATLKQPGEIGSRDAVRPERKTQTLKAPAENPASPQLQAAKGNDEVMSQPPQPEPAPTIKPVPKETAQEAIHQVMPKAEARKLITDVTTKAPLAKALS